MTSSDHAAVVVVGGGTVGAWTAVQLAERGVGRVVLLEAKTLGAGASSRAAGMVRAQGGTETAIRLGMRTQDFYRSTGGRFPLDCGFVAQGYLMPCFTDAEVAQAVRLAFSTLKLVVEPGGAVGLAALLAGKVPEAGSGACVGLVLSGGNVDPALFARILQGEF
jgi:glycine/D-amino acid oxidase-like deaminating enzyme